MMYAKRKPKPNRNYSKTRMRFCFKQIVRHRQKCVKLHVKLPKIAAHASFSIVLHRPPPIKRIGTLIVEFRDTLRPFQFLDSQMRC